LAGFSTISYALFKLTVISKRLNFRHPKDAQSIEYSLLFFSSRLFIRVC